MRTQIRGDVVASHASAAGWRRLLDASALGVIALLLCAAGGFRDLEAAAMAAGGIAGVILLRFRTGLIGEIGLGALFANTAAWMAPGAVSNLTHHENWVASALPASLAVLSLAGLLAVAALLLGRRVTVPIGRAPRTIAIAAVVLIAAANVSGAVGGQGSIALGPHDLSLTAQHVKFSTTHLETNTGRIGLVLSNLDLFWHTFTVKELGVNLNVPVQAERRIAFDAAPGTYEFICKIPGHAQAGMKGTLTVR